MAKIRIPSGTRDLFGEEVRTKRMLQRQLNNIFSSWGYQEIMTPALEYYQTYNMSFASLKDGEMYKFFDENGDILTLRMDMTVPIARAATSRLKDCPRPLRLQYASNVFKVRQSFAGKRAEVMDCGVELIGKSRLADLEILLLALDVLSSLDLDSWTLEIGNGNFFSMAAGLVIEAEDDITRLADLIDRKSMVELKEFLDSLSLSEEIRSFFLELPLLSGGKETIEKAYEMAFTPALKKVALELLELYSDLEACGFGGQISFDFGKVPHLQYYTGIIFEGFVSGAGTSILSGGRYDSLLQKFGQDEPACGFSVKIDYLLDVIKAKTGLEESIVLKIPAAEKVEGMRRAASLRKAGYTVVIEEEEA